MSKDKIDRPNIVKFCEAAQESTGALAEAFLDLANYAKDEKATVENFRYQWSTIQRHVGHVDAALQAMEIVLFPGMLEVPEVVPKAGDSDKMVVPPFDDDRDDTDALGADTDDDDVLDDAQYDDGADEDLPRSKGDDDEV